MLSTAVPLMGIYAFEKGVSGRESRVLRVADRFLIKKTRDLIRDITWRIRGQAVPLLYCSQFLKRIAVNDESHSFVCRVSKGTTVEGATALCTKNRQKSPSNLPQSLFYSL